ncbi:hypothetical protein [Xanthobacter sp. 91]|uniref:hypothetical protein n=1 Tax=Xanthobacter sp. 91 TaxID=1117244 RepID=UPI00056ED946|nr:hypothetical protein [Xanthobacter sp. 91]
MFRIIENEANCKPSASVSCNFFMKNPERKAFIDQTPSSDVHLIDVDTRDRIEHTRRLCILRDIGFEMWTVHERITPIRGAGGFQQRSSALLIHRDVGVVDDERTAQILSMFASRNYVLPGFRHLSAYDFWNERWCEEFVVLGRARISVEQMLRWTRPRKPELDQIEAEFEKAARAVALKRQKARSHLRFRQSQCVVA